MSATSESLNNGTTFEAHQQPVDPSAAEPLQESQTADDGNDVSESRPVLALPPAEQGSSYQQLDIGAEGGSTVKLDHLGPMVVNQDGTLSQITNWAQMSEIERRNTLRVLGKRNQARLAALKEKAGDTKSG